jgi:hypothetical protein
MRPDQVEAALTQGVGDIVAYALVVTPDGSNGRIHRAGGK